MFYGGEKSVSKNVSKDESRLWLEVPEVVLCVDACADSLFTWDGSTASAVNVAKIRSKVVSCVAACTGGLSSWDGSTASAVNLARI